MVNERALCVSDLHTHLHSHECRHTFDSIHIALSMNTFVQFDFSESSEYLIVAAPFSIRFWLILMVIYMMLLFQSLQCSRRMFFFISINDAI